MKRTRADKVRLATRLILARGEYPSPQAVHKQLGDRRSHPHSLSGRDLPARNEVFEAFLDRNPNHRFAARRRAYQAAQARRYESFQPNVIPERTKYPK